MFTELSLCASNYYGFCIGVSSSRCVGTFCLPFGEVKLSQIFKSASKNHITPLNGPLDRHATIVSMYLKITAPTHQQLHHFHSQTPTRNAQCRTTAFIKITHFAKGSPLPLYVQATRHMPQSQKAIKNISCAQ